MENQKLELDFDHTMLTDSEQSVYQEYLDFVTSELDGEEQKEKISLLKYFVEGVKKTSGKADQYSLTRYENLNKQLSLTLQKMTKQGVKDVIEG